MDNTIYAVPVFGLFMQSLFPEFSKRLGRAIVVVGVFFTGLVFFTPAKIFTHTLPIYQGITLMIIVYGFYVVIFAAVHRREGALVFLVGFLILVAAVANDMLHVAKLIQTGYFVPFALFAFILAQSLLHSLRLRRPAQVAQRYNRLYRLYLFDRMNG